MTWSLVADRESQVMVTMEFSKKERKVFLWRETRWQPKLLQGETERATYSHFNIFQHFFLLIYQVKKLMLATVKNEIPLTDWKVK